MGGALAPIIHRTSRPIPHRIWRALVPVEITGQFTVGGRFGGGLESPLKRRSFHRPFHRSLPRLSAREIALRTVIFPAGFNDAMRHRSPFGAAPLWLGGLILQLPLTPRDPYRERYRETYRQPYRELYRQMYPDVHRQAHRQTPHGFQRAPSFKSGRKTAMTRTNESAIA
jgi:hypothetical protein